MKNFLLLLVALTPTPGAAREVLLDVFAPEAKPDFAVLVPQSRAAIDRLQPTDSASIASDTLASAQTGDFIMNSERSVIAPYALRPAVPAWMRGGGSLMRPVVKSSRMLLPDPICQTRAFFPRSGISRDAQARRTAYFKLIVDVACAVGVPVVLFDALLAQESRYRPFALSKAGAMGMAQLMPATARHLRVGDPWNVRENLMGGARYLRDQLGRFGTWPLALAAYNAGPGRVDQFGGIPPFRETHNYVRTIMGSIGHPDAMGGVLPALAPLSVPDPFRRVLVASFEGQSDIPEK